MARQRPYTYYDLTTSLCATCLEAIPAKIVFEKSRVFMLKRCPAHGHEKTLIATEADYYRRMRDYAKPGEIPQRFNTPVEYGCPYDCGLCTDHEQHSCLTVVEITDRCNLACPTCYAMSSPSYGRHRTVDEVKSMLDAVVLNEGEPDVVQISGGEPTIHPDFFAILDAAKRRPIRHLMVNTNGVRIAEEDGFAERLAAYMPGFELYLQFDSFEADALKTLRGADLRRIRERALDRLDAAQLSTTLVVTVQKGVNDHEIGAIIEHAASRPSVRGVTFQPVQVAGRNEGFDRARDRYTLTECRRAILDQSPIFEDADLVPVPCNPDALVMGYALKIDGELVPLTRYVDPDRLLDGAANTVSFERDRELAVKLFSTGDSVEAASDTLKELFCCLPRIDAPNLGYENVFRIVIMRFMDAYDFDVRAVKKSCVHIVHKDGRIIPFETMNLLYRDHLAEKTAAIQAAIQAAGGRSAAAATTSGGSAR